ncbi:MAG: hypothetical protein ACI8Q1_000405 [Parvicella sp.]|jgi:hypothetical protein
MENKILIISKNDLKPSFWSKYINESESFISIIHIDNFEYSSAVEEMKLIIMDNYFDNEDSHTWMRYQAHFLRSKNYQRKIFFLSPHYADYQQKKIVDFSKVSKHTFSLEFLAEVNKTIIKNRSTHQI